MNPGNGNAESRLRLVLLGAAGLITACLVWELLGRTEALGRTWPPLTAVIETMFSAEKLPVLMEALKATAIRAAEGYVIGSIAGIVTAALAILIPRLASGLSQLATILYAIPVIALGPLLLTVFSRDNTAVAIAALSVFFTTFIATVAGFQSVRRPHLDVMRVLGATRWQQFRQVQMPTAIPAIVDALKIGAPAAILGAIVGEWFGVESGIGPLLISAMQNFQINLLWAAALLSSLASIAIYGVLAVLGVLAARRYA